MKKYFLKTVLVVFTLIGIIGLFRAQTKASDLPVDQEEIIKLAQNKAGFLTDDLIPTPEVNYLSPGSAGENGGPFSTDKKVINFLSLANFAGRIQVVYQAPTYKILDGKKSIYTKSFKNSIGGILTEANVELAKEDKVDPSVDSQPVKNEIKITRVSLTELEKFESIPFATKEVTDDTLERGIKKVNPSGEEGKRRLVYQLRREDGVEVSRILIKNEIAKKPTDRVIRIGTKVVVISSVKGLATIYKPSNCSVVSANYKKGTAVRITNLTNGVQTIKTVDCTWGTANAADGNVLDLSLGVLAELKYNGYGAGPNVLVEELKN